MKRKSAQKSNKFFGSLSKWHFKAEQREMSSRTATYQLTLTPGADAT